MAGELRNPSNFRRHFRGAEDHAAMLQNGRSMPALGAPTNFFLLQQYIPPAPPLEAEERLLAGGLSGRSGLTMKSSRHAKTGQRLYQRFMEGRVQ
jgi:hypothetical protein